MRAANEQLRLDMDRGEIARAHAANREFHDLLFAAAASPSLLRTRQLILLPDHSIHTRMLWGFLASFPEELAAFLEEHEAMVRAIESGDPARAHAAATRHADGTGGRIRRASQRGQEASKAAPA
jgi:DNA-binding GntR family transcriptional regulator